jgi:hypothetical protein
VKKQLREGKSTARRVTAGESNILKAIFALEMPPLHDALQN